MTKQEYIDLLISTSAAGGFPSVDGALVQEALIGHIPDGVTHEHLLLLQGLHDSMGRSGVWVHDKFVSGVHEILD